MSWWVYLKDTAAELECSYGEDPATVDDPEGPCPSPCYPSVLVERHAEGGTYALGGTDVAELNVTYNYGAPIRRAWKEDPSPDASDVLERLLDGKRAGDVVGTLAKMVDRLGVERSSDYWEPTDGNAGYALRILAEWARQAPEAVFKVH